MLDELVEVIKTLQTRMDRHGDILRGHETRTRTALVDPLLQVLGWDTTDPVLVTQEYNVGGGRADYALLGEDGKPRALIEAKHLGEPLEGQKNQEQVFTYALIQQVKYASLTDGNLWVLDDVSDFVTGDRRRLSVSIAKDPVYEIALKLLALWRPNLASGQLVEASEPIISNATQPVTSSLNPTPGPSIPSLSGQAVPQPKTTNAASSSLIRLSDFRPRTGDAAPLEIHFPDGRKDSIQNPVWWRLVEKTAAWLWSKGHLTSSNVPVSSSETRNIVNIEPKHPDKPFKQSTHIDNTALYTERNIDCKAAASNARKLLTHCKQDPSQVYLKLGK